MSGVAVPPKVVVLGIGNLLLTDDGVGVHAIRAFSCDAPDDVITADVGTSVLNAEYLLDDATHLLVFDAMSGGGPPGTVYAAYLETVERGPLGDSLHNITLRSLRCPPGAIVIGAEPGLIDAGMELTPPLQAAIPRMLEGAHYVVERWMRNEQVELGSIFQGTIYVSGNSRKDHDGSAEWRQTHGHC